MPKGKIGRGQRKKSHARYVTEKRSEINKLRKIEKQRKFEEKKKKKRKERMEREAIVQEE